MICWINLVSYKRAPERSIYHYSFRTLSNIYNGVFLQKGKIYQEYLTGSLMPWIGWYFLLQRNSIKFDQDIWVLRIL